MPVHQDRLDVVEAVAGRHAVGGHEDNPSEAPRRTEQGAVGEELASSTGMATGTT